MEDDKPVGAGSVGRLDAWYGAAAYAFQIYFDFSGYSDMAISLGLTTGFTFAKNFDSPYHCQSITEFWRRSHLSLSTRLRDYLHIPLVGNRRGEARTYLNLAAMIVLDRLSPFGRRPADHQLLTDHVTAEYRVKTEARRRTSDEWKARADNPDKHWFDCLIACAVGASIQGAILPGTGGAAARGPQRVSLSELQRQRG